MSIRQLQRQFCRRMFFYIARDSLKQLLELFPIQIFCAVLPCCWLETVHAQQCFCSCVCRKSSAKPPWHVSPKALRGLASFRRPGTSTKTWNFHNEFHSVLSCFCSGKDPQSRTHGFWRAPAYKTLSRRGGPVLNCLVCTTLAAHLFLELCPNYPSRAKMPLLLGIFLGQQKAGVGVCVRLSRLGCM